MTVIVRRATVDDAPTIADFALKLFAQHREYDPVRFADLGSREGAAWFYAEQTKAEDAAVLVAEMNGMVVGFAYVQYEERNYAELIETAAWLHDIYVNETVRRSGAATALIDAAAEAAKEMGANKLILTVAAKNQFARVFFERRGFTTTMVEMMLALAD